MTCDNCAAYNYRCTFDTDTDRKRGRYEILESRAETLLAALRSVAPHLAEQYEAGDLNIAGPSGGSVHPDAGWIERERQQPPASTTAPPSSSLNDSALKSTVPGSAPAGPRLGPSAAEMAAMLPTPVSTAPRPSLPSIRSLGGPFAQGPRLGPMVPDLEDGRPRFYGKSSTLSHFHALDSRPPSLSPPPTSRSSAPQEQAAGRAEVNGAAGGLRPPLHLAANNRHSQSYHTGGIRPGEVQITRPAQGPQYPSNSREWVHLLRRKNTVAVGSDAICTDEWMTRYMLPAEDLVFHLLDDIYFPNLHPLLPILHPPSIRRDVRNGRPNHDTAFRGLIFCILTVSSRFSTDRRVLADPDDPLSAGDHWAAGSRLYHQTFAASLINVQMLLLTSTFMHASIGPGSSWTVLGVALRALMDIGLHQERANADFTPFDQEMRRRTFWAAFILDCIFAVCLGRPNAIRLEDCNVHLPLDVTDEALTQSEATGQPIVVADPGEADEESDEDDQLEENAKGQTDRKEKKHTKTPSKKLPGVACGFRHMVKLNLLVHDVVETLYSHRKTGNLPEWRTHPGAGPSLVKEPPAKEPEEGKSADDPKSEKEKEKERRKEAAAKRPEYRAMAQLCKRLDEWVSGIPEHLSSPATSPYKLQAGIIACARYDIRLYILKPFLPDQYLYKMLHPQCVSNARSCLQTVIDLWEGDHLASFIFIFTQAFMSSVTFLLTVWHVTVDVKDLMQDANLIERTAKMMALAFDDRYCSALFRKAWRVLQRIASRVLPLMGEEQRLRTEKWITAKDPAWAVPIVILQQQREQQQQAQQAQHQSGSTTPAKGSMLRSSINGQQEYTSVTELPTPGGYNFATAGATSSGSNSLGDSLGIGSMGSFNTPPRHFSSPLYPWQTGGPNGSGGAAVGGGRLGNNTPTTGAVSGRSRPTSRATSPTSFTLGHWTPKGSHSAAAGAGAVGGTASTPPSFYAGVGPGNGTYSPLFNRGGAPDAQQQQQQNWYAANAAASGERRGSTAQVSAGPGISQQQFDSNNYGDANGMLMYSGSNNNNRGSIVDGNLEQPAAAMTSGDINPDFSNFFGSTSNLYPASSTMSGGDMTNNGGMMMMGTSSDGGSSAEDGGMMMNLGLGSSTNLTGGGEGGGVAGAGGGADSWQDFFLQFLSEFES